LHAFFSKTIFPRAFLGVKIKHKSGIQFQKKSPPIRPPVVFTTKLGRFTVLGQGLQTANINVLFARGRLFCLLLYTIVHVHSSAGVRGAVLFWNAAFDRGSVHA